MATKKDVEKTGTEKGAEEKAAAPARPMIDLTERFGLGDMWPSWLSGRLPDVFAGAGAGLSGFRVEEFRDGDELVIRGEMPGLDPENDIDITVDRGRISIRAERERREESEDGLRSEFHYGSFARVLSLPEGANVDEVTATYEDGILEVRLPVAREGGEGRKVDVSRA